MWRKWALRIGVSVMALLVIALGYVAYQVVPRFPAPTTAAERVAMFPTTGLNLEKPVTIYWHDRLVPFVHAETDSDAAYVLGMVQAHLRLGQLEMARRIATGRIAEMGGPFFMELDKALRVIDFDKKADAIFAAMTPESRLWLERFVEGINDVIANSNRLPLEFQVLGLEKTPWRAQDVIAIGRMGGIDVNWFYWATLLQHRSRSDWPQIWRTFLDASDNNSTSFEATAHSTYNTPRPQAEEHAEDDGMARQRDILGRLFMNMGRIGSNSLVVAPERSANGHALIANDPHLGIMIPNMWLIAGVKSPSYHAVGMMAPGLPIFAFGRNQHIAWGGTNLRGAISDLYDVSDLPEEAFTTHRETVEVRMWPDTEAEYRTTRYGPVINDIALLPQVEGKTLALSWTGHQLSDEITAMLDVAKATNWEEFRAAYQPFSVPAENMLYADEEGNIGQLIATFLPRRSKERPSDILVDVDLYERRWSDLVRSTELPYSYNPEEGFLASANNKPTEAQVPIGYFFPIPDRIDRIKALLSKDDKVSYDDLVALQQDVYSESNVVLRDVFVGQFNMLAIPEDEVTQLIRSWDGHFHAESRGALAYAVFFATFSPRFYDVFGRGDDYSWLKRSDFFRTMLAQDLTCMPEMMLRDVIIEALDEAKEIMRIHENWGDIHRLDVSHLLSGAPLMGALFRGPNMPVSGSKDTVMKTAHPEISKKPHDTNYGSQARHISDLSDPDANYFVLLGGQDGWFGSSGFIDQVELWNDGEYIHVPLKLDSITRDFPHQVQLKPGE